MKRLIAVTPLLFAAALVSAEPLEQRLVSIASRIDGVTGVAAVHIESGRRVTLNAGERFPMASVYKVPIAIITLRRVDAGKLSLDQKIVVRPEQYHPGHSPIREETRGKKAEFTVRRLLKTMVSLSDNTSSDVLMELCGGAQTITRELAMPGLRIDRTELEILRDYRASGTAAFLRDPRDTSTPVAMTELLVRVWNGRAGLSASSQKLLLQFMRATTTGPNRIRAGVPKNATVAHKTGSGSAIINDAGVISSPDGSQHVAITIFTKAGKATTEQREAVIATIARQVYGELITPAR